MKVTETMIEAFFRKELNEYQNALVKEYFRLHPEALQQYLTEKNWQDFNPTERLAQPVADKMFHIIEAGTYGKNRIRRMYYQWASVAAVLVLFLIGYHFLTNKGTAGTTVPAPLQNRLAEERQEWKNEINHTKKTIKLSLRDGSEVELAEGSEIRYHASFAPDKREIYLTGSALFKVGKDKARPFTVVAGRLYVTALGTVFRVVAPAGEMRRTAVRLLSGKVIVRPDSLLEKRGIKAVCLDPGQQLLLDRQKFTVAFFRRGESREPDTQKLAGPALTKIFTFNNEPLEDIFKDLSAACRTRLIYRKGLLKDMTFTGRFNNQKETLGNFLNTIATLNNLTIKKGKNSIYISQ